MSLAPPCCAGRAANCMPTGPLPTGDLSLLCALPLTTAPHPTPLVTLTRVVLPFCPGRIGASLGSFLWYSLRATSLASIGVPSKATRSVRSRPG